MAIRKISQTPPTMASIVNAYSTSENDGYACDYVNNLHTYSTTEQRVGTWIDGKPIYRIVFTSTTSSSSDNKTIGTINNLDTCISMSGIMVDAGYKLVIPSYGSTNNWINIAINDTNGVYMGYASQYRGKDVSIIVEYTKTTD